MTNSIEALSEREIEILRLVATGVSNKEIATALSISPNTVKVHLRNIFAKIGVLSRTEATLYAIKNGIVAQPGRGDGEFSSLGRYISADADNPLALVTEQAIEVEANRRTSLRTVILWVLIVAAVILGTIYFSNNALGPASPEPTQPAGPTSPSPRWQENRSLPGPRAGMGGVAYSNRFYLIGGETRTGISSDLLVFQIDRQEWTTLASKPTAVTGIEAALIGEKIYVPGGKQIDGSYSNALEVYDPRQNAWETRAAMPTGLNDYALTAYEGNLFVLGGWDGKHFSDKVFRYDPDQDRWETRDLLPGGRTESAAAALDGRIILLGGRDASGSLSQVWIYYPDREGDAAWQPGPALPGNRFGLTATVLANSVFIIGGQSSANDNSNHTPLVLLPDATSWQALNLPATSVGSRPVMLASGNFLHVLGGQTGEGLASEHLVYQALYTVSIPLIANEGSDTQVP